MPAKIPADLLPRARQIIMPLVTTEDEREALLTEAFYLYDPLLYGIERKGAGKVFAIRCIKKLLDHGCLPAGEHSLARLLETARYDCGVDKHAEIDQLVQITNALCVDNPSKPDLSSLISNALPPSLPTQTIITPRDERSPTVFISYSHADADFAQKLITDLNQGGHACWIDTSEIKGGDEWIMSISEGIINSYRFVPILSAKAMESAWVRKEIMWAIDRKKPIIPIILEEAVFEHPFFFLLKDIQGITVFDSDYGSALPKLLSYLPKPSLTDVEVSEDELADDEPVSEISVTTKSLGIVPRKLELSYMERLKLEELLNTEKYTAMGGESKQKAEMRSVFELIKVGKQEREQVGQETRKFENAVEEIQDIRRCVLLGEPGGGKTTTLWKLADDLIQTALKDKTAPIPILIRLGKWTDKTQSLTDFIAEQLGDLGAYFDSLLKEKRASLLLDGLNEMPTSQQKAKYPQVQALIEAYPDALAVVSCRELDYTIDLGFDKINITPLDPLRIREFGGRYLGEEKGNDLFWRLAGEKAKQTFEKFSTEFAGKIEELEPIFWLSKKLADNAKWGYSWRENDNSYWENWLKERETPSGLMLLARNPYMLLMLCSVYADEGELPANRGQLFAKFVETLMEREAVPEAEQDDLIRGLAQVAYEMQLQRIADETNDKGNALTVLSEEKVMAILGERRVYLAGSASILSLGEQVRFTHQLLQEYFAASYMDAEIEAGRLKASDIWQTETWWERTNWEEATILLAGLYSDDPTPVIDWLMDAQAEQVAEIVLKSGATTPPDETLLKLREAWIPRLTDLQGDSTPQARASIGRALGQLSLSNGQSLDNRKGVGVKNGLPDIDWVLIPSGEYSYQDGVKRLDYDFKMSRYPVTYAQFQSFIDDPEGVSDSRWWQGLPEESKPTFGESYPTNEIGEQAFKYSNHPRERVNWYQAIAFCRWYSWKLGGGYDLAAMDEWVVRLPTEFEWEKAMRGTDGREYPYEGDFDASKGNTDETGIAKTSAVGIFPSGASPYGVLDMSGNVYEWCLTDYENPDEDVTVENINSNSRRVLRGGSWDFSNDFARAVPRFSSSPGARFSNYGFRVSVPLL